MDKKEQIVSIVLNDHEEIKRKIEKDKKYIAYLYQEILEEIKTFVLEINQKHMLNRQLINKILVQFANYAVRLKWLALKDRRLKRGMESIAKTIDVFRSTYTESDALGSYTSDQERINSINKFIVGHLKTVIDAVSQEELRKLKNVEESVDEAA